MSVPGVHSKDIDSSIFTSDFAVGSNSGGEDFSLIGNPKIHVEEITFYIVIDERQVPDVKKSIGQIKLRKSDGTCLTVGAVQTETKTTLTLKPREKLTRIRLLSYENRLAGVDLFTSKHQHVSVQIPQLPPHVQSTEIPVGTGECVGIFGRSGMFIDSLGFAMLRP